MTVNEIIQLARFYAHINENQLSNDEALRIFNIVYKQIGRDIITYLDENFFYERWTRDPVYNQPNGEYPYPTTGSNIDGAIKIIDVYIKPTPNSEYIKCTEVKESDLPKSWDYYLMNQPSCTPIYFIADKSIFIAPQWSEINIKPGAEQILLVGYKKLIDLPITATEQDILIDEDYHEVIALGMAVKIFLSRGMLNEYEVFRRIFDGGINRDAREFPGGALGDMLSKMNNRRMNNLILRLPNETKLQYGS